RYIAFPSAIPSIIAGIRISMGVGWMCLVGAEIFGAGSGKLGLGKNLWTYYNLHQMPNVVVYMLVLGLIGLVIDMIFRYYVGRRMYRWKEQEVR
ncbi:MAG: ABC transporter permease subunit, partial [Methanogenium sp.]|nr:ABC transporter permease subunit [Methanogenium sp.]